MLYNTSTGKPEALSLESVIAWLEQQPADQDYYWFDNKRCGGAQYCTAHGLPVEQAYKIPHWTEIFMGDSPFRWTFGAALERARVFEVVAKERADYFELRSL